MTQGKRVMLVVESNIPAFKSHSINSEGGYSDVRYISLLYLLI